MIVVADQFIQRCVLMGALALTTFGIVRVGLLPAAPPLPYLIHPLKLQQLRLQGWQVSRTVAAQRRQRVSNAEGVVLQHAHSETLEHAELTLIPVRGRTGDDLGSSDLVREITGRVPVQPRIAKFTNDDFVQYQNDRLNVLFSSCIAAGQASTSKDVLSAELGRPPTSWSGRLKAMVGLAPTRDWSCLLITFRILKRDNSHQLIGKAWSVVRPVLTNQEE